MVSVNDATRMAAISVVKCIYEDLPCGTSLEDAVVPVRDMLRVIELYLAERCIMLEEVKTRKGKPRKGYYTIFQSDPTDILDDETAKLSAAINS